MTQTRRVRTFTTTFPIRACRLRRDDLKRLYRLIHDRQLEYRDVVLGRLAPLPAEKSDQFDDRKTRVANAFTTTVNITGTISNEVVSGQGEEFFDNPNIPDDIKT